MLYGVGYWFLKKPHWFAKPKYSQSFSNKQRIFNIYNVYLNIINLNYKIMKDTTVVMWVKKSDFKYFLEVFKIISELPENYFDYSFRA